MSSWSRPPKFQIELDGSRLSAVSRPGDSRLWLEHRGDTWHLASAPDPQHKGPHRFGSFKDALRNRVLLVYGTPGTTEENTGALHKARFDAETFWYRGNGTLEVIPDTAFDPVATKDRNVILYGRAEMNLAWQTVLASCPIHVRRGKVQVGAREWTGDDLGCLWFYPRRGSDLASVGVVAGTGLSGQRGTERLPYFVSGVGYPDYWVLGADAWSRGLAGIRAAGYFGQDWKLEPNDADFRP